MREEPADLPICLTCGTQYRGRRTDCPVCSDERQYVRPGGQRWTDLGELRAQGHAGRFEEEGPRVLGVGCRPAVAIGQRALILRTESGNVLWDCVPYLDDDMVGRIKQIGGLSAIAVSHPHFYGAMVEWAHAFDAPVHLHAADKAWVGRPDPSLRFWDGETYRLSEELTLINGAVHFPGSSVLHWDAGDGALFTGDTIHVCPDSRWVTVMYSYPNHIPERPQAVRNAANVLGRYRFERVYGAWWGRVVTRDGNAVLSRSMARYLRFETGADGGGG
ncbi:MBL fold metallo-hydrolase [Streptomyces heilongjiangensis]|uniref:MBL fold metallo-hydrolase n=1 Tax=Streptomyces heilongjiangensis TaxID=945052 RepID=A0ABW1AZ84_9ACTN|nr:MBL fold metallo-hydrolase [Streptomyces heilongjiangensis]MDC2947925.1 MBL fold metallo-hydrolase [Streptomyces heilongjiangensis]